MNKVTHLNINILSKALKNENSESNLNAFAICLIKKLYTHRPLHSKSISHLSPLFGTSKKTFNKAMSSYAGQLLLSYEDGMLHAKSTVGKGQNIAFKVVPDDMFNNIYSGKMTEKIVRKGKTIARIFIPIKESLKYNLSHIRKQIEIALILNHISVSNRAFCGNIYADNSIRQSSWVREGGFYEGVSVERFRQVSCLRSKRTTERRLSETIKMGIFTPVGREVIHFVGDIKEASRKMREIKAKKTIGETTPCLYMRKSKGKDGKNEYAVMQKLSNRFEFCYPSYYPTVARSFSNSKLRVKKKIQKLKDEGKPSFIKIPKRRIYPDLNEKYHLTPKRKERKDWCAPDIAPGATTREQKTVYRYGKKKNITLLKDTSDLTNLLKWRDGAGKDLEKGESRLYLAPCSLSTERNQFDPIRHRRDQINGWLVRRFHGSIIKEQEARQSVTDKIYTWSIENITNEYLIEKGGLNEFSYTNYYANNPEKLNELKFERGRVERRNTYRRAERKYRKYVKECQEILDRGHELEDFDRYCMESMELYIKLIFIKEDKKVKEQWDLTYEEYALEWESLHKYDLMFGYSGRDKRKSERVDTPY